MPLASYALWLMFALPAVSPGGGGPGSSENPLPDFDVSGFKDEIAPVPPGSHPVLVELFASYTRLVAPNGAPIHFLAQNRVSRAQLIRAREVMRFFLTDAPGTRFGADKRAVANAMADARATLVFFNTERDAERAFAGRLGGLDLFFQDLYATECVVEGSRAYLDRTVRDATFEEVFHLVQGAGIRPALPAYQRELEAATRAAVRDRSWFPSLEWVLEGSTSEEYIISVIDVFYGLWAHDPDGDGRSFGGEYAFATRAAAEKSDPLGCAALRMFLPDVLGFEARIAEEFEGTFHLDRSEVLSYTVKSRYLRDATLVGSKDSNLVGNRLGNVLRGNAGGNRIDGGAGIDTLVLSGAADEYSVARDGDGWTIEDSVAGRDGTDVAVSIECLRFADGSRSLVTAPCPKATAPVDDRPPSGAALAKTARERPDAVAVVTELLLFFDEDGDAKLRPEETTDDFREWVAGADTDGDGAASGAELTAAVDTIALAEFLGRPDDSSQLSELFTAFDSNADGLLTRAELPAELWDLFAPSDANVDGGLEVHELTEVTLYETEEDDESEIEDVFASFDRDGDGRLRADELPDDLTWLLEDADPDGDGAVTRKELREALDELLGSARFDVDGARATMVGLIDETTPDAVRELARDHPEVDTIVMKNVEGSLDDVANLEAARLVRGLGLRTHVSADGTIASGGTDFFLAGAVRTVEPGARVGVHSWATEVFGVPIEGRSFPPEHQSHRMFLDYYEEMGIPADFYWFTLNAAGADDVYWTTPEDQERFGMTTAVDER